MWAEAGSLGGVTLEVGTKKQSLSHPPRSAQEGVWGSGGQGEAQAWSAVRGLWGTTA